MQVIVMTPLDGGGSQQTSKRGLPATGHGKVMHEQSLLGGCGDLLGVYGDLLGDLLGGCGDLLGVLLGGCCDLLGGCGGLIGGLFGGCDDLLGGCGGLLGGLRRFAAWTEPHKVKQLQMMTKSPWLLRRVFYLVTYMWQMSVYIVFMAVFAIFGSAIGLKMFTMNSWGVQVNTLHVRRQR